MIEINNIYINPQGTKLFVQVSIKEYSEGYTENVGITRISVGSYKNYSSLKPNGLTPINDSFLLTFDTPQKEISYVFDIDGQTNKDKFYLVEVNTNGSTNKSANTPCGLNTDIVYPVYWKQPIYNKFLDYFKEFNNCTPPLNFINYYLKVKAFEYCLKICKYEDAKRYWEQFFDVGTTFSTSKCGCSK